MPQSALMTASLIRTKRGKGRNRRVTPRRQERRCPHRPPSHPPRSLEFTRIAEDRPRANQPFATCRGISRFRYESGTASVPDREGFAMTATRPRIHSHGAATLGIAMAGMSRSAPDVTQPGQSGRSPLRRSRSLMRCCRCLRRRSTVTFRPRAAAIRDARYHHCDRMRRYFTPCASES